MIPWDQIFYRIYLNEKILRFFKVIKIIRVFSLLDNFFNSAMMFTFLETVSLDQTYTYFIGFFISIFFFANIISCLWSLVTVNIQYNAWFNNSGYYLYDFAYRYLCGLFWVISTIMTIGFGDIVPNSKLERIFAVIVIIIGVAFYSYTISTLTSILFEKN